MLGRFSLPAARHGHSVARHHGSLGPAAPTLQPIGPTSMDLASVRLPPASALVRHRRDWSRPLARALYGGRISGRRWRGMTGSPFLGPSWVCWARLERAMPGCWSIVSSIFSSPFLCIAGDRHHQRNSSLVPVLILLSCWPAGRQRGGSRDRLAGARQALCEGGRRHRGVATAHRDVPRLPVGCTQSCPSGRDAMAAMIVFEATLSFLGMGVQPPTPSWGDVARRRII